MRNCILEPDVQHQVQEAAQGNHLAELTEPAAAIEQAEATGLQAVILVIQAILAQGQQADHLDALTAADEAQDEERKIKQRELSL